MPLIKGAKPNSKGFKKNIETEMSAGKPQRQAVAIAYSESGERKKKGKEMKEHKAKKEKKKEPKMKDCKDKKK